MGTSVLHIKTEVECRVYLFDEEKGIAKPGTYFNLEVRKGEQDLLFVSTEDEASICFMTYNVEERDCDYRMTLERSLFVNVNSKATEKEITSGIEDEFGVVYSHDGLQLLQCLNKDLMEYNIPDGCKVIRRMAFNECNNLKVIIMPDRMTHIGYGAFSLCDNLTTINLPYNLKYIGNYAFSNCYNLTNINLPDSLTYLGNYAFGSCSNLSAITLPDRLTHIREGTFWLCDNLSVITLPAGLTHIGNEVFNGCNKLTTITLPDCLIHIGDSAFEACKNLTTITLPICLTHIGNYAFSSCENLMNISLPTSLIHIGDMAFYGCHNLTAITLPTNLTYIGDGVFTISGIRNISSHSPNIIFCDGCLIDQQNHRLINYLSDKDEVSLPAGLTHIGDSAFCKCNNIISITLPASLTHIGYDAFWGCVRLSRIAIPVGSRTHFENLLPEKLHEKLIEVIMS